MLDLFTHRARDFVQPGAGREHARNSQSAQLRVIVLRDIAADKHGNVGEARVVKLSEQFFAQRQMRTRQNGKPDRVHIFLGDDPRSLRVAHLAGLPHPELKEERNAAYEQDRRVLVFVYKHDVEIDPAKWPCPRATEGVAGCRRRERSSLISLSVKPNLLACWMKRRTRLASRPFVIVFFLAS